MLKSIHLVIIEEAQLVPDGGDSLGYWAEHVAGTGSYYSPARDGGAWRGRESSIVESAGSTRSKPAEAEKKAEAALVSDEKLKLAEWLAQINPSSD